MHIYLVMKHSTFDDSVVSVFGAYTTEELAQKNADRENACECLGLFYYAVQFMALEDK